MLSKVINPNVVIMCALKHYGFDFKNKYILGRDAINARYVVMLILSELTVFDIYRIVGKVGLSRRYGHTGIATAKEMIAYNGKIKNDYISIKNLIQEYEKQAVQATTK